MLHEGGANFPWQSHGLWFYSQMVRWGQIAHSPTAAETARQVYRPDLYRAALAGTDADWPTADAKVEGGRAARAAIASQRGELAVGPDGFFDGLRFDPNDIEGYLRQMPIRHWPASD